MIGCKLLHMSRIVAVIICLLLVARPLRAEDETPEEALIYLKNLSIEQLASLEVTTVSKKEERLSNADAAVYVITSEDIRRSGFTSIPEILRMVPGMQVAQIDGNKWAISSRGFNAWFADKLLVLIDGRSVYTSLFSGVNWDVQDTLLEDIDRIEVIRGPGATLWGANAVNGVINIITKKARDTQGGLITAGGGNIEQGFGSLRYGGKIGQKGWYRAYTKYFNRGPFELRNGQDSNDDWNMGRSGFRIDWNASDQTDLTLQGDIYIGQAHDLVQFAPFGRAAVFGSQSTDLNGGNILGRWSHRLSSTSDMTFQWYYDRTVRDSAYMKDTIDTLDLDFQHSFRAKQRHGIIWGLGYRLVHDNIPKTDVFYFEPKSRLHNLFSAFFQDQISIVKDRLDITLGTKLEHNDYSGFEIQPSARIRFKPDAHQTFWAAVSRAVRTPSRADRDMNIVLYSFRTGPTENYVVMKGNDDFDSEELVAYEAGYRFVPEQRFSFDIATFYNVYRNLRTSREGAPEPPLFVMPPPDKRIIPLNILNQYHEDGYGIEISGTLELARWWKISMAYSWLKLRLHTEKQVFDMELGEGNIPRNQVSFRSYMDLPHNLQLDTFLFHVDELPQMGIPGYNRLDLRLGWSPIRNLSISFKVQNMLDNRHPEYTNIGSIVASQIPRSFYGKISWSF